MLGIFWVIFKSYCNKTSWLECSSLLNEILSNEKKLLAELFKSVNIKEHLVIQWVFIKYQIIKTWSLVALIYNNWIFYLPTAAEIEAEFELDPVMCSTSRNISEYGCRFILLYYNHNNNILHTYMSIEQRLSYKSNIFWE